MSKLNKNGAAAVESCPYHRISDTLAQSITVYAAAKTLKEKKEAKTMDLLMVAYNNGHLVPEDLKANGLKASSPFYTDSPFYMTKQAIIASKTKAEQALLAPETLAGLQWTTRAKAQRTALMRRVSADQGDLRISFQTHIRKSKKAAAEKARDTKGVKLTKEQRDILREVPSEQTTVDAMIATISRMKKNHDAKKSVWNLAVNVERAEAILTDMLKVKGVKVSK